MENPDPLVSIILPTYNRADTIRKSIRSILEQTYTHFELIVVDDGSDDHTEQVVNRFDDTRLRYTAHAENKGVSAARNTGITMAQGNIIAFQDSDDIWLKEKLQKTVDGFRSAPPEVGVVYTGMWRNGNENRRYLPSSAVEPKEGNINESIIHHNFVSTQMASVRSECFDTVGLFDERLPALVDWELWIRIAAYYQFNYIDEPLVWSTVRADSISNKPEEIVRAREYIVNKHRNRFDKRSLSNHLFYIGHGALKLGQTRKGRTYLQRALVTDPTPTYLISYIASLTGSNIYEMLYKTFKRI